MAQYNEFRSVRSIREYKSNVAEAYWMGRGGYRTLKMVLRHSRLDKHIHQTRNTAIGKYRRLAHRQANYR